MSNYRSTLIIESFDNEAIQAAFKMAETCFSKVSPIIQTGHTGHLSFIIASMHFETEQDNSFEYISFEEREQLDFIDWCEKENIKARKKLLSVKRYFLDILRTDNH